MKSISLIGVPVDEGAGQRGCQMGPDAFYVAKLPEALRGLGYDIVHEERLSARKVEYPRHSNTAIHDQNIVAGWIEAIAEAAEKTAENSIPIFLGGDHSLSAGSVAGVARAAEKIEKPVFVLWLDAHSDFHTPETTDSGNLHGTPVAYFTGQNGFDGYFPKLDVPVDPANICMMGLRSVDDAEGARLLENKITVNDMRAIDEHGIVKLLKSFLDRVIEADGWLHVSLDVDFLDPEIAPAVGTTVPGGANFREAHLIMEMLHETGLVRSLDLVELNPFLDHKGRTAKLLVELTASLFGRKVIDRVTRSY